MGKVRRISGTSQQSQSSPNEPSTSRVKKSAKGRQTANLRVKCKSKLAKTVFRLGSVNLKSLKGKKKKLQKDLVVTALKGKLSQEETGERQINILALENVSTEDPGLCSRVKKRKKRKQAHDIKSPDLSTVDHLSKRLTTDTDDVPLVVEMPEMDVSCNTNIDDAGDSSQTNSLPVEESEKTSIPIAVVMPIDTFNQITKQEKEKEEEKSPTDEKPIVPPTVIDESRCVELSQKDEVIEPKETAPSILFSMVSEDSKRLSSGRKRVSENMKVHLIRSSVVLQLSHPIKFFIFGQAS